MGKGVEILIVDDEQAVLDGVANRIEHIASGDVTGTRMFLNAADALAHIQSMPDKPYLILADVCMPGMDGLELIRQALEHCANVRAIVLSAHSDFTYAQQAVHLGADDYLLKPVRMDQFQASLLRSLARFPEEQPAPFPCEPSEGPQMLGSATLEDALRYISDHLGRVDLATLANYTDLNYSYFSEAFKKSTGRTFSEYLAEQKMRAALEMLRSGGKVADITDALGYRSPKNFTRAFKRFYGVSPSRWRSALIGIDK